jgi:hypothetical protein
MRGACEIFVILGSEQQSVIRDRMYDQTGNATTGDETAQYLAATIERLVDIVAGKVVSVQDPSGGRLEVSGALSEKALEANGPPGTFRLEVLSLSNAAANVLAGMTDGDEADWPDGAPPLRETLYASGVFPKIDSN